MKTSTLLGMIAGAAVATSIIYYKKNELLRASADLRDQAKTLGNRLVQYGTKIKDRLLHNVKGPNGEAVYLDMYDRQFYEDQEGKRIYLELA